MCPGSLGNAWENRNLGTTARVAAGTSGTDIWEKALSALREGALLFAFFTPGTSCGLRATAESFFFLAVWIPPRTSTMPRQCTPCCIARAKALSPRSACVRSSCAAQHQWKLRASASVAVQSRNAAAANALLRAKELACLFWSYRPTDEFFLLPAPDTLSSFRISSLPFGSESWRRRMLCQVEPPCGSFARVLRRLREF